MAEQSVCGEAGNGIEAVEKVRQLHPVLVHMGIDLPRMHGQEATRNIRREVPEFNVIIPIQNDATVAREQARKSDANGFIAKFDLARDLLPMVEKFRTAKAEAQANIAQGRIVNRER